MQDPRVLRAASWDDWSAFRWFFGRLDNIMEIACGQDHQRLDRLVSHDFLRRHPDATKVRNIMRGVVGGVVFPSSQRSKRCC